MAKEADGAEEEAKKVRKVGLKELAKDIVRFEPEPKKNKRRSSEATGAYFSALDAGREFLVWSRKNRALQDQLPDRFPYALLELEKLVQKMNMDAIMDSFDYEVRYNEYYFDLARIETIALDLSGRLSRFLKNEKALEAAFGEAGTKEREAEIAHLRKCGAIARLLEQSAKLFLDQLERDYELEEDLLERAKRQDREMIRVMKDDT